MIRRVDAVRLCRVLVPWRRLLHIKKDHPCLPPRTALQLDFWGLTLCILLPDIFCWDQNMGESTHWVAVRKGRGWIKTLKCRHLENLCAKACQAVQTRPIKDATSVWNSQRYQLPRQCQESPCLFQTPASNRRAGVIIWLAPFFIPPVVFLYFPTLKQGPTTNVKLQTAYHRIWTQTLKVLFYNSYPIYTYFNWPFSYLLEAADKVYSGKSIGVRRSLSVWGSCAASTFVRKA